LDDRSGQPLVSVVVVNFNGAAVLDRCLRQLVSQDHPNYEIVLVDDASTDSSVEIGSRYLSSGKLSIVSNLANEGCAGARNVGLRHAQGNIVAFVDADGFAEPHWLRCAAGALERDPSVGAVASLVFFARNRLVLNGAGGTLNWSGYGGDVCFQEPYEFARLPQEILYPMGCGMVVRRAVLDRIGAFDPSFVNYYDDVDLGIRVWRAGYRVVLAPDAWVDHGYGHSGGPSPLKTFLCERNRIRVVLKYFPFPFLLDWFRREIAWLLRMTPEERQLRLRAWAWNLACFPGILRQRFRWSLRSPLPRHLMYPSCGYFPPATPDNLSFAPDVAAAARHVMFGASGDVSSLHYGWYFPESDNGRTYRWMNGNASLILRAAEPSQRLTLEYRFPSSSVGGAHVVIRSLEDLEPLWKTFVPYRDQEWRRETHTLSLVPGEFLVLLRTDARWCERSPFSRTLGMALTNIELEGA
jgi:GT2 family glycosyltransferase